MPSPVAFMQQYRSLKVEATVDDPVKKVCREQTFPAAVRKYFMMNWKAGTEQKKDYDTVTKGSKKDAWFKEHAESIRTAAMGKGAPKDYEAALEWAVMSGQIKTPTAASIQAYCDEHLGIDCSGFVTNYLIANGKKADSHETRRNTGAESYFAPSRAVNDPSQVRQGDLLVFMTGTAVKRGPGHVAVVESYSPQSKAGGNMRVVEATGAAGANPKLLDSLYTVESIIDKSKTVPVMILVVKRHGVSGFRTSVMRY